MSAFALALCTQTSDQAAKNNLNRIQKLFIAACYPANKKGRAGGLFPDR
jgi:hypothetical protein